ncbi:HlyD family type I secretion periplasmic adaptor subunit [Sphingobium estronivorans]|uniref:HlyD family type I secretion periplasmic adaptor subunit n=1 Tax=Sphingobium estronivorans TaxID=1577690 RepID=UPI0013C37936|nr:HlyD family type I secretion periplasmic adaptor subunit [Sphingobium estronivorans]
MNYQLPSTFVADDEAELFAHPEVALRRSVRISLIAVAALFLCLFLLAAVIQTRGAVIGQGEVTVESRVKQIAHPNGGVIAEMFVKEGDRVQKGQKLMRLDSTVSATSAARMGDSVDQLLAARVRLTAERDGRPALGFPAEMTRNPTPAARLAMAQEMQLFEARRRARAGEQAQYAERIRQAGEEIRALQAQAAAANKQSQLIAPEREGVKSLYERKLVTISRLNQLERTAADLEGTEASLGAQIAQSRARIAELRQQSIQADQAARAEAGNLLADVQSRLNDQEIRSVTAGDSYDRSLLRAPYAGIVDKLSYSTVGGVVPPMQTIMQIVPDSDRLTIEIHISPYDIDQLHLGQKAVARFTAFNLQSTPELSGTVARIAPERTVDDRTGNSFYKAEVEIDEQQLRRLGTLQLKPGMPVECFVQTEKRSLLSYITKPLRDQFNRAFREN